MMRQKESGERETVSELVERLLKAKHETDIDNTRLMKEKIDLLQALLQKQEEIAALKKENSKLRKELGTVCARKPSHTTQQPNLFSPVRTSPTAQPKSPPQPPISHEKYARLCSRKKATATG